MTVDINFVSLKSSNDESAIPYAYTQALAKQLNTDREINLKKNDFLILFNTDLINYILTVNPNTSISPIILHEIIHGLGFLGTGTLNSYGVNANSTYEEIVKSSSFMPSLLTDIEADAINNANTLEEIMSIPAEYDSFVPLSIYQKYLIDLNTNETIFDNLGFIHEAFNQCLESYDQSLLVTINDVAKDCFDNFNQETKDELVNIAQNYYVKNKSIGFLPDDNNLMIVQTFENDFLPASSISHNDSKQHNIVMEMSKIYGEDIPQEYLVVSEQNAEELLDENFLMYYHVVFLSRDFILKTITKNNKHGLIGPKIVSTLKTIGWTEKGDQFSDDLYYVDNDNVPEQNAVRYIMKYYSLLSQQQALIELPVEIETETPIIDDIPTETSTVEDESEIDDLNVSVNDDIDILESDESDEEN